MSVAARPLSSTAPPSRAQSGVGERMSPMRVLRMLSHPLVAIAVVLVLGNLLLAPAVARAFATGGMPFLLCEQGAVSDDGVTGGVLTARGDLAAHGMCEAGCTALGALLPAFPPEWNALAFRPAPALHDGETQLALSARPLALRARGPPLA